MRPAAHWQWFLPGLCVVLAGCTSAVSSYPVDGLTITNLKVGMVCRSNANPEICSETNDMKITGEGRCVYNGKSIPCTWYGYSFDYQLAGSSTKLQCIATSSVAVNYGNPKEELKRDAKETRYEIELTRESHHFVNPQYSSAGSGIEGDVHSTQSCAYEGKNVFQFAITLHYPNRQASN